MSKPIDRGTSASTRTPVLAPATLAMLEVPDGAAPSNGLATHSEEHKTASASPRKGRATGAAGKRFAAVQHEEHGSNRQAELFYLQKQIQLQTHMVFVLEDGSRVQGVIEWYDRHAIKVRGKSRVLIYKTAIKYLYKQGEPGSDE